MAIDVVAADLPAQLLSGVTGGVLVVREPPARWGPIKPALLAALRSLRARRVRPPELAGIPRCALGAEHGELPPSPVEPRFAPSAACASCRLRETCSPPAVWSDELAPFGPADPIEQWRSLSSALAAATNVEPSASLDALVTRFADARLGAVITLEPSLALGPEGARPSLRLAVFHGRLPDERRAAHAATRAQLDAFSAAHLDAGAPAPTRLVELLATAAPMAIPLGFELTAGELRLKAYARVHTKAPAARARLLADLVRLAAEEGAAAVGPSIPPERLGMIGVVTTGGRVAEVKAYVEARPTEGAAALGLAALPADHLLVRLSRDRAHAVVDVASTRTRAPKWDFRLRDALLPGHLASRVFAPLLSERAVAALVTLTRPSTSRLDVVAASVRGDEAVLYFDVG